MLLMGRLECAESELGPGSAGAHAHPHESSPAGLEMGITPTITTPTVQTLRLSLPNSPEDCKPIIGPGSPPLIHNSELFRGADCLASSSSCFQQPDIRDSETRTASPEPVESTAHMQNGMMERQSSGSEADDLVDIGEDSQIGHVTVPSADHADFKDPLVPSPALQLHQTIVHRGKVKVTDTLNNPLIRRRASLDHPVKPCYPLKRPKHERTSPGSSSETTLTQSGSPASYLALPSSTPSPIPSVKAQAGNGADPGSLAESYLRTPESLVSGHDEDKLPNSRQRFIALAQKAIGEFDLSLIQEIMYREMAAKTESELERMILHGSNDDLSLEVGVSRAESDMLRAKLAIERKARTGDSSRAAARQRAWDRKAKDGQLKLEQAQQSIDALQEKHGLAAEAWAKERQKLEDGLARWKAWSEKEEGPPKVDTKQERPRVIKEEESDDDLFGSDDEPTPAIGPIEVAKPRPLPRPNALKISISNIFLTRPPSGSAPNTTPNLKSLPAGPLTPSLSLPSGAIATAAALPLQVPTDEQVVRKKYDRLKLEYAKEKEGHARQQAINADLAKRHFKVTAELRHHAVMLHQLRERIDQCSDCRTQEATLPPYPAARDRRLIASGNVTFAPDGSSACNEADAMHSHHAQPPNLGLNLDESASTIFTIRDAPDTASQSPVNSVLVAKPASTVVVETQASTADYEAVVATPQPTLRAQDDAHQNEGDLLGEMLKAAEIYKEEVHVLQGEMRLLKANYAANVGLLEMQGTTVKTREAELREEQKKTGILEARIVKGKGIVASLHQTLKEKEDKLGNQTKRIADLEALKAATDRTRGMIAKLKYDVHVYEKTKRALEAEVVGRELLIGQQTERINGLEVELASLQAAAKQAGDLEAKIRQANASISRLEAEAKESKDKVQNLQQAVTDLQSQIKQQHESNRQHEETAKQHLATIKRHEGEISVRDRDIARLIADQANLSGANDRANGLARDLQTLRKSVIRLETQIHEHETTIASQIEEIRAQKTVNFGQFDRIGVLETVAIEREGRTEKLRQEVARATRSSGSGGYRVFKENGRDVCLIDDDD